jgi:hypothetical protein
MSCRLQICADCRLQYLPATLPGHIKTTHKYRLTAAQHSEIEEIVKTYKIQGSRESILARLSLKFLARLSKV